MFVPLYGATPLFMLPPFQLSRSLPSGDHGWRRGPGAAERGGKLLAGKAGTNTATNAATNTSVDRSLMIVVG